MIAKVGIWILNIVMIIFTLMCFIVPFDVFHDTSIWFQILASFLFGGMMLGTTCLGIQLAMDI